MNRTIVTVAAVFSASSLLLVDSAVKGTVLLALAAVAALILRRDSAATRHLVWLLAIVAMLVVPLLSAMLPQWRVLPAWMSHSPKSAVVDVGSPAIVRPADVAVEVPQVSAPVEVERSSATVDQRTVALPDSRPALATPEDAPAPAVWSWNWIKALPLVWVIGFSVLILRLSAARWMLWNSERRATVICRRVAPQLAFESRSDSSTAHDPIVTAMEAICSQLGIGRPVTLLIHPDKTIPIVWGILRCRLMLPAAARQWSDEQLRSVLLHELAHIKRRDTVVQLLAQVACALHWFNPLVWFAAWRLNVERERSCDDLVLASGVRPSAYAGHLLEVVTGLSPARWTQSCGLAMARKSSLEGRLGAVLGKNLNRRGVSVALAGIALAIAVGIAVPIAMLRAADEKWNPPHGAHIGGNDFSALCVHDGKDASFVIVYHGDFDSTNRSSSNSKARTWTDSCTITAEKPGIALSFHRTHTAPGKLSITTAPAEGRDLGKPAPAPRDFGQKEYDLARGRVFLLTDSGLVRQFDLPMPVVTDQASAKKLAALIAAIPPQQREDIAVKPKHKDAREYYEVWQRYARANGDIPGALIGELAASVKTFIRYNPTWETVPKLNAILPRLDATHDWKPANAIALLDEVAGIQNSPLKTAVWKGTSHTIRQGEALPKKFADAPWGEAQPNGLHAAWVLEPVAAEHRIGVALKARLLVQNRGQVPVMVQVPTWHQGWVKASDAKGAEVKVSGISWTTLAALSPVRLAPGEYIEINTPGVGLGPRAGMGPWAAPRVGTNVLAKPGDELTLTHGLVPLDGSEVGVSEDDPHVSGPGWWLAHIKTRLARELPLPAAAAERTRLLDRAVRELFATAPSAEETAAFIADNTPDALDALAKRLAARVDVVSFSGKLATAPAKFRVLAADANADKQPRVVLGPGEYPLPSATATRGDATLKIVGRPVGDRRTNDAQLLFEPVEFTGKLPPDPHKLEVPDGWGTWAIVCRPNDGFFYLLSKGAVRKIDYSSPRKVTDTPVNDLPAEFRDEVKRQLDIHGITDAQQAEMFETAAAPAASLRSDVQEKPKTAATESQPKTTEQEVFTAWGKEISGLQAGLGFLPRQQRAYRHGEAVRLVVRVRNVGKEEVKFQYLRQFFLEKPPTVTDGKDKPLSLGRVDAFGEHFPVEVKLPPGKEIELYELKLDLGSGNEAGVGVPNYSTIYGTGKFQIQYEKVLGNSSSGSIKLDSALSKLATGKLELEIKPVAPVQQEAPKPKVSVKLPGRIFVNAGLRTAKDEKRFSQSEIVIEPNTGSWTRLQESSKGGFTVPLSPVRVSPDGKTMLFMREKEIWKCDAMTGENPVRVFEKGQPKAWSPDGKEFIVVVEKDAGSPDKTENWRVSADGKNQSLLSLSSGVVVEDWSTDGRWLLGWSHADGQLHIMKPDGSERRPLTNTNKNASRNEHPRFSPDGRHISYLRTLYQGADNAPDSRFSLRTINMDGTDDREILGETAVVPAPANATWTAPMGARWSPDGKHLAVVLFDHTRDGGILAINGNWRLAIIDADGGNLRELMLEGVLTTVLLGDGPEWRPQAPAVITQEPKQGARLKPATEQKLKWGEPVNGLRMALAWPPTLGEPGMGAEPEFYLVVQNVSEAAVRLTANDAAPNPRTLMTRDDGKPLQAMSDKGPTPGDWLLQTREVTFLRMFPSWVEKKDGRTVCSIIEEDISSDPRFSFTATMTTEKAPAGAWTGMLKTGETRCSADVIPPKHKDAQTLYKSWATAARRDGKISGAVIGRLGESVKTFIKHNPTWETTPQLQKMLPRFDASRDWSGQDAVGLLDELAALQSTPISMALEHEAQSVIRTGTPLPPELANAPWGDAVSFDPPAYPHPNGLRVAWLLEPRAAEHRLGTPLKARVLIHNSGKIPVVFRTRTWHQLGHKATDANGADIKTESTSWTTRGVLLWYRLAPGEFIEVSGPGIGVGPVGNREDWQQTRVGTWIEAKAGDEVKVTTGPLPLMDWGDEKQLLHDGEMPFWRDHITARLSRHLPFPAGKAERELLLYRVALELFGTPVSEEISAAFVSDREPTALKSLAERLHHRAGLHAWAGSLTSAPTKFRVLAADPDAAHGKQSGSVHAD